MDIHRLSFLSTASAAPLSPADRNTIQQQLIDENQRQREELERSVVLSRVTESEALPATLGSCFIISRIEIDGTTLLPRTAADRLTAPWLNQCLDMVCLI